MEPTVRVPVLRVPGGDESDALAVEEPLEIRLGERPLAVTMRTPGDDFDLAAGFLFTEGVLTSFSSIDGLRHWGSPNVVRVALREGVSIDWQRFQRHFYASSSCGVCGKASIELVRVHASGVTPVRITAEIAALPERLREQQTAFAATGGIHGAGLFTAEGALVVAREDVGRHNAVDKAIGALWREGARLDDKLLVVSGRAGFEIVQKAAVAGIPALIAVGAPTSLAVELAHELGLTLLGFVRDGRFNVYAGSISPDR
ncbi:MAG TPA: formate dehydrogenase accessory sulfurtransferase FdhD [Thermoanaerobaculia bacterium]|jgi:FdhD protein|nr:formate dehydrogenase accessory sulfurtransferase FdhD [Thermoanaerobaculia bacterium]